MPESVYESYREERRRAGRDSFVEVDKAYYEAPPEFIGRRVWVRWDGQMVRLFNDRMEQVGCHARLEPGKFSRCLGVRGLHGSIKCRPLALAGCGLGRGSRSLGAAGAGFLRHRGQSAALWDCANWPKNATPPTSMPPASRPWTRLPVCSPSGPSNTCWKRAIRHPGQVQMELREVDPIIRPLTAYGDFIRRQAPEGDPVLHPETTTLTEPQPPSKAP